ncbi:2-oxoglutarate dehydrogenase E1 component/2-oxoglutarate decarboxylase [Corynebacterium glutamicum]|nr:2-oxoglutarate dehydrogenase E1 component/2-oxoglutarate decarboxylase [Corynebacterium glutamicum]
MSSASTFGQNAWLVDEMFQQFQKDPKSVDKEWRELFEAQGGTKYYPRYNRSTAFSAQGVCETSTKGCPCSQGSTSRRNQAGRQGRP